MTVLPLMPSHPPDLIFAKVSSAAWMLLFLMQASMRHPKVMSLLVSSFAFSLKSWNACVSLLSYPYALIKMPSWIDSFLLISSLSVVKFESKGMGSVDLIISRCQSLIIW